MAVRGEPVGNRCLEGKAGVVGGQGDAHGPNRSIGYRRTECSRTRSELFTIRGIEVGVHYSWLIVFALLTWSLSVYELPQQLGRGRPRARVLDPGRDHAILLFASVLIHELAHSFVAQRPRACRPSSITLFIFGGVSNLTGDAKSATTEFLVAVVGPLTSFVLAGIAFAVATAVDEPRIGVVASYLFSINLQPGHLQPDPRLSARWRPRPALDPVGHDRQPAPRHRSGPRTWASSSPWLMFAVGICGSCQGDIVSGVWLGAIAWFLHNAASASVQQMVLETRLGRSRCATSRNQ